MLHEHAQRLQDDISRLQNNLVAVQQYLAADLTLAGIQQTITPNGSAMDIMTDSVRRQSNGVADVLLELEADILPKIDAHDWTDGYDLFWHHAATHLMTHLG